jgi:O-antigen/teichoic acid export membrane protein
MLKKILGTTGSKLLTAIITLLIVLVNTRFLGAEGFGTVGLIGLAITIILLFNNFIGGTALIYLASRENLFRLLIPGYIWSVLNSLIFLIIIRFLKMVPTEFEIHVVLLSFIFSVAGVNLNILLGKELIRTYNIITVIQAVAQLLGLYILYYLKKDVSVHAYIMSVYFAFGLTLLLSTIAILRIVHISDLSGTGEVVRKIFRLGSLIQIAYTLQMFNYRLSYYIIDHFLGRASVGMFHFGNQLAEGTWIVSRSIATVQYSKVSNSNDLVYSRKLSMNMLKLTFIITVLMVFAILMIPGSIYQYLGVDFGRTRIIILSLSIGIITNACSMMFSHYFAGIGKPHFNTIASGLGLVFTIAFGFLLIPKYGIIGAGITASVSYSISMFYQFIVFFRQKGISLKELLISRSDVEMIRTELRQMFNSFQQK